MKTIKKALIAIGIIAVVFGLMSNKKNLSQGRESMDATWHTTIDVSSAAYTDNGYFRILNDTTVNITLMVQLADDDSASLMVFTPGFSPCVVKMIDTSSSNTRTTLYIVK